MSLIYRYATVSFGVYLLEQILIQYCVNIKHINFFQRSHDLPNLFVSEVKSAIEDLAFMGLQQVLLLVDFEELLHLVFVVVAADLLP